jgi:hypothetical protein
MRKLFAVAITLVSLLPTAALAVTIEPLPGTTPQATHVGAFFPVEIGVVVRDDLGQPIASAPVHFLSYGLVTSFASVGNGIDVVTDANGVAIPPFHYGTNAGVTYIEATTPDAAQPARFDVEVYGEIPDKMSVLSGNVQTVAANGAFPERVVVRTFAPNNLPVPYAMVQFYLRPDGVPSGLFEGGVYTLLVKSDANGVATAPNIVANAILGTEYGSALCARSQDHPQRQRAGALFKYRIVAP